MDFICYVSCAISQHPRDSNTNWQILSLPYTPVCDLGWYANCETFLVFHLCLFRFWLDVNIIVGINNTFNWHTFVRTDTKIDRHTELSTSIYVYLIHHIHIHIQHQVMKLSHSASHTKINIHCTMDWSDVFRFDKYDVVNTIGISFRLVQKWELSDGGGFFFFYYRRFLREPMRQKNIEKIWLKNQWFSKFSIFGSKVRFFFYF